MKDTHVWHNGEWRYFTKAQLAAYREAVMDRRAWYQYRATEMHVCEPPRVRFGPPPLPRRG